MALAYDRSFRDETDRDDRPRLEPATLRLPRTLSLSTALPPLERALNACGALRSRLGNVPFQNNMIRVESKLDALAFDGIADRVSSRHPDRSSGRPSGRPPGRLAGRDDDRSGALLRLMIAQASGERPGPRDLRLASHALDAFRHGLSAVRAGGRAALTGSLFAEMVLLVRGAPMSAVTASGSPPAVGCNTSPSPRIGLVYPPVPHDAELGQAMLDLERFLTDPPPLPLPVRTAMAVAWVELLAPFEEESAQLARLLTPLMAVADGRPPLFVSQVLAAHREDYAAALAELEAGQDWEAWIGRYLDWLVEAAEAATIRLERTERLRLDREADMESLRSDSTARRLAELAFGMPVLTVSDAQEMLEVSFQTANAAVATLVRLGILAPHSNIRRNRVFIFGQTLDMLAASLGPTSTA